MARPTSESGTVTRKPDDAVGSRGEPPAGGGHQTADQAAITDIGGGGKPQTEPKEGWGATCEPAGRRRLVGWTFGPEGVPGPRGRRDGGGRSLPDRTGEPGMSEAEAQDSKPKTPKNVAPDAVKDPNEKTEGHPGAGPAGGGKQNDETDPGSS